MKRIYFSDDAKADVRAVPQPIVLNILHAIQRLAESGGGDIKTLKGKDGDKRLRVGDYRVRYTEEHPDVLRIHAVKDRKDAYR